MAADEKPVADNLTPRTSPFLAGHGRAVEIFLKSWSTGRMHHAWLLAGPKGIGKATLAYHMARFLLKQGTGEAGPGLFGDQSPPDNLVMAEDDPIFSRVAAGAEGNLKVIERGLNEKTKRMRQEIIVKDVRALHSFFELTAAQQGWRIAIIDSADEMNRNAANALLKMLEEPPAKSLLLLVSHAKGRLPATIRSRCQQLLLAPLEEAQVRQVLNQRLPELDEGELKTLTGLCGGVPGLAVRMALFKGMALNKVVRELLDGKVLKIKEMHDFAGQVSARGQDEKYFLFLDILQSQLAARIRAEAGDGGGKRRLDCWLQLWEKVNLLRGRGEGLNMGRKQGVLLIIDAIAALHRNASAAA
ncbi:MAG: DNA polymerase III subunit delta' [Proteobacteria bacterium]|nr:DNA polymerase III subunit delta' [Pseudomonadota bacterium]